MINKYFLSLFTSIVAVSFASIFIISCDAAPLTISLYRLFFTTLLVLPIVLFRKKTRSELSTLPTSTVLFMVLIGLILAAHFSFWISSLTQTSIASSVILVTAHPVLVGPLSYFLLREKLSLINAFGIITSVTGVIFLVVGNYGFSTFSIDTLQGNILAMLGGIFAGLYILGGRKTRKTVSIWSYALVVYAVGTITLFFICLFFHTPIFEISIEDIQIIFVMALISGILGHTLYNWSLEYIRASVASVFLLGEPIGSAILAFAIPWIHQVPSYYTIVGGGIILFGIYLVAKDENKFGIIENL
jgi:drug/metabolite transporter (DMT)-like permease